MAGPFYEKGAHAVQILQIAGQTSSNGNPMIVAKVKVMGKFSFVDGQREPQLIAVPQQYDRTIRLVVTDKSQEMVLKKLRWAGWQGESFKELYKLLGTVCRAVCDHDVIGAGDKAGQMGETWDFELPPRESKPVEDDPGVFKKLDALFGKSLKADKKPAAEASAAVEAPSPTAQAEIEAEAPAFVVPQDEVPF
jgi:hypothetical protein